MTPRRYIATPELTAGASIIKFEQRDWHRCITSAGANPLELAQADGATGVAEVGPVVAEGTYADMVPLELVVVPLSTLAPEPRAATNSRWAFDGSVSERSWMNGASVSAKAGAGFLSSFGSIGTVWFTKPPQLFSIMTLRRNVSPEGRAVERQETLSGTRTRAPRIRSGSPTDPFTLAGTGVN
jgi:hypothetical protein